MPKSILLTPTGTIDIDSVLWGLAWDTKALTYSFPTSVWDYRDIGGASELNTFAPMTTTLMASTRKAVTQFSNVSGLTFVEKTGVDAGSADLRIGRTDLPGYDGIGNVPGDGPASGDMWIDISSTIRSAYAGDRNYYLLMHEFGHTLGLKHPHAEQDAMPAAPTDRDSMEFSVMSYKSYPGASPDTLSPSPHFAQTLMRNDIAALQSMYGANYNYNSGATVYSVDIYNRFTINGVLQETAYPNLIFRTIWDGGGRDVYDFRYLKTNLRVDLAPGAGTYLGDLYLATVKTDGTKASASIFNAYVHDGNLASLIEDANGGSGNDLISGNQADNSLAGNDGADTLSGLEGNDTLAGGWGNDSLDGGAGNDVLQGDAGDDVFIGGDGNDTIDGGAHSDTIRYTHRRSDYVITENTDYYSVTIRGIGDAASDGVDLVKNGERFTFADGTFSYDDLIQSIGKWTGTDGADTYVAQLSDETILGMGGDDDLTGSWGNDSIDGGAGDDTITLDGGHDTVDGGTGFDVVLVDVFAGQLTWNGTSNSTDGSLQIYVANRALSLSRVESVTFLNGSIGLFTGTSSADAATGTSADDLMWGASGDDTLDAGAGDDTLGGGDGDDSLSGGTGDDQIRGGKGDDTIHGGSGTDTLSYERASGAVVVDLAAETATGADGTDSITGIDWVVGSRFADKLIGDAANNTFTGGEGNDTIDGGAGIDWVEYSTAFGVTVDLGAGTASGSTGQDTLLSIEGVTGSIGADSLKGSDGADMFRGLYGDDTIDGGDDIDVAIFRGYRADYDIRFDRSSGQLTVRDARTSGSDGSDTLSSIEILRFADGDVASSVFMNKAPVAGSPTVTVAQGGEPAFADALDGAEDGDGDALSVVAPEVLPEGVSYDASSHSFRIDPAASVFRDMAAGETRTLSIAYAVSDGTDRTQATLSVTVTGTGIARFSGTLDGYVVKRVPDGFQIMDMRSGDTQLLTKATSVAFDDGTYALADAVGGAGADLVAGSDFGDSLSGGAGADILRGNGGDDTLEGGAQDDILLGGIGGGDVAVFSGRRSDYDLFMAADGGLVVRDRRAGGPDGTDTLYRMERLRFADMEIDAVSNVAPTDIVFTGGTVTENSPPGTVVATATGADPDAGSRLTYALVTTTGAPYSGPFVIDALSGAIAVAPGATLDFDERATHTLVIKAIDQFGLSFAKVLTISVANVVGSRTGSTGTAEEDLLQGTGGSDTLAGLEGSDTLRGMAGGDSLDGGAGADSLDGGAGADTMAGGAGNDTYAVENAGDIVRETVDGGIDTVRSSLAATTLGENLERLVLTRAGGAAGTGNGLDNVITGANGPDTLAGDAGRDTLLGGAGRDSLRGDDGADSLDGGAGADTMIGAAGVDTFVIDDLGDVTDAGAEDIVILKVSGYDVATLNGASVRSMLTGTALADMLRGGMLGDTLDGGAGADILEGFAGDDTYVVDDVGDEVREDAGSGTDTVRSKLASYTLHANVERLALVLATGATGIGNGLNNLMTGAAGGDLLQGLEGLDTLNGGAGNDSLDGGDGNDSLDGGTGADTLNGGAGADTLVIDDLGDSIIGAEAQDLVLVRIAGYDTSLLGPAEVRLQLTGTLGTDSLVGGGGTDSLSGLAGADTLLGGAGRDTLRGGDGDDVIEGGADADLLYGGAGADRFVFAASARTGLSAAGWDRIADFDATDTIDLSGLAATFGGPLRFTNKTFDGGARSLIFSNGFLGIDANGDRVADLRIQVSGATVRQDQLVL